MGKIESPSIFRSEEQAKQLRKRMTDSLDRLEEKDRIITEDEVAEVVAKAIGEKFSRLNEMATKKSKPHSCPNCGAPLHDGKCDYCGTTIGG